MNPIGQSRHFLSHAQSDDRGDGAAQAVARQIQRTRRGIQCGHDLGPCGVRVALESPMQSGGTDHGVKVAYPLLKIVRFSAREGNHGSAIGRGYEALGLTARPCTMQEHVERPQRIPLPIVHDRLKLDRFTDFVRGLRGPGECAGPVQREARTVR